MRRRFLAAAIAAVLVVGGGVVAAPQANAAPEEYYTGTHFGAGNVPPGCENDVIPTGTTPNVCHHMKTDLNGLDSNLVDVLIMVPASPTAERDARITRQAVEMWAGGIEYLAPQMGLDWLSNTKFEISTDIVSFANGTPIYTYPVADPEIVIISSNPVGGAGIGIDPFDSFGSVFGYPEGPCHGLTNPFDFEAWDAVPGFDHHHRDSGTYTEDCGGAGGNICFTVAPAIDPVPPTIDVFNLYDLVSHEFGHCLTLGHVGDGGECVLSDVCWGNVPTNDIMSYNLDPEGLNKCVSTLDVESFATLQSKYVDTNGDGRVTAADKLAANDPEGQPDDASPFMTQHPRDHFYASGTGKATDCPQPDLGVVPGQRTDWTPEKVDEVEEVLTVVSPAEGAANSDGNFTVEGTVERRAPEVSDPTESEGSYDDADDDASSGMDITEITFFKAWVDADTVEATIHLAEMPPGGADAQSPTSYTFTVDGRSFDSFVYPIGPPSTFDNGTPAYVADSFSSWDVANRTVNFHIPRDYLATNGITAPYYVSSSANFGAPAALVTDDRAPDREPIGLAAPSTPAPTGSLGIADPLASLASSSVTLDDGNGNAFAPTDSTLGEPGNQRHMTLDLGATPVDATFTLSWTGGNPADDLDLVVADSGAEGATQSNPEVVHFDNKTGVVDITIDPFLVTSPTGVTYTLTADIFTDADGDGIYDEDDACPNESGNGGNGCAIAAVEQIRVYLDEATTPLATQDVDTIDGSDTFSIQVSVPVGTHRLRIDWKRPSGVVASKTVTVTHSAAGTDADADGVPDSTDNCVEKPNPQQENLDGDAKGDECDSDLDGDGHSNGKEKAHGTDPRDPQSFPTKGKDEPPPPTSTTSIGWL